MLDFIFLTWFIINDHWLFQDDLKENSDIFIDFQH